MATARRVTVIAHELRGFRPAGGMGTATTFLALALARLGHSVEVLLGKHRPETIDPRWEAVYRNAGVGIRPVPELDQPVEPWDFDHSHRVALALTADPPDVVIAHDFGAPVYAALRRRQAGLGFDGTLFVVFCHGTRRYVVDLSPNVELGDLRAVLGIGVLEQAAVELADAVVSPSAYLVDWMRGRGWQLPERTFVIPYFTESEATGAEAQTAARPEPDPIERLAFFGRVDEKKGVAVKPAVERGVSSARWNEVVELRPVTTEPTGNAGDFELLLDDGAVPDPELEGTLRRLQRATDADIVTCGVRVGGTLHFFAGDAGGLGALRNTYGTVALVRRELLDWDERGATWPLLARLAAGGARIVSLPVALAEQPTAPGSVDDDPAVALLAAQQLERALPEPLRGAARLAAGLAAADDVTMRSNRRRRRGWRR